MTHALLETVEVYFCPSAFEHRVTDEQVTTVRVR